ncbi:MAG: hypothetical protein QME64_00270 [bacterium]|nr:hypothetical protein [bacterium]
MPKGELELEYYTTVEIPDLSVTHTNTWKHWFELEYGLTDRWDISMYQMFSQKNSDSDSAFDYDGMKLRTRYRLGEKGQWFVEPLLYLEYIRESDLDNPHILEGKIVFARDFGRVNISYNQIIEQALEEDAETEHEFAFGMSYEFTPRLKSGIESKGNFNDNKYYLGPTISFAATKVWWTIGALWGVNERSTDMQFRSILGIPFD